MKLIFLNFYFNCDTNLMTPIYLDELPKTTIELKNVYGLVVQENKYWFDYVNNVIIRRCNLNFDPKPFALIQGPKFQPVLKSRDKPSKRFDYLKLINDLAKLYQVKYGKTKKSNMI